MSSNNTDIKIATSSLEVPTNTNTIATHAYDITKEENSKIRFLMSYYGY